MKLKTINVIETADADAPTIHAFTADDKGREQANELFRQIAREQTREAQSLGEILDEAGSGAKKPLVQRFTDEEIEQAIIANHGLNDEDGTWTLQILTSEWNPVPQPISSS